MDQENRKTHAAGKKETASAKKEPAAPEKAKEPEKTEKNNIQDLIDKAKAKGSLTNTEILAALGDADYDIDQIDKLYEALDSLGIDVNACFDDEALIGSVEDELENDLDSFDRPENMERALASEGLMIDDPVKLYLKEIGRG